jgi:hypothetical protein
VADRVRRFASCLPPGLELLPLAVLLIADAAEGVTLLGSDLNAVQLRRARMAGAGHAVVFVARMTPALIASVDALRSEGMSVDIARSVHDAAEFIHPEERVLLMPAAVHIAPERLSALVAEAAPHLLCLRDTPVQAQYELIDATTRWTGFALIDGDLLRRTADMVGDWDFASTLLRRALQEGAMRTTLTPDEVLADLAPIASAIDAAGVGRRLIARTSFEAGGWGTQWLVGPFARLAARFAGEAGIEGRWLVVASFGAAGIATIAALAGWIVASLLILLVALTLDLAGAIVARAGSGAEPYRAWRMPVRTTASSLVVLSMGTTLMFRDAQWGCAVLAMVTIGATWLSAQLVPDDPVAVRWRSDAAGHALIGLAGFAVGVPTLALAIAATHAVGTLAWAQRKVLGRLARP